MYVLIEALEDWFIRLHDEREKPTFSKFFISQHSVNISVLKYMEQKRSEEHTTKTIRMKRA
jgi:hypothetical protein